MVKTNGPQVKESKRDERDEMRQVNLVWDEKGNAKRK
jgi:hypothetical protein